MLTIVLIIALCDCNLQSYKVPLKEVFLKDAANLTRESHDDIIIIKKNVNTHEVTQKCESVSSASE